MGTSFYGAIIFPVNDSDANNFFMFSFSGSDNNFDFSFISYTIILILLFAFACSYFYALIYLLFSKTITSFLTFINAHKNLRYMPKHSSISSFYTALLAMPYVYHSICRWSVYIEI